jgi:hypothetical protein
MSSTWLLLDTAHGLEGGRLPVESIIDNIQIYGDVKAGDKELGGSGGLNGIRWGQKSYTEYVQGEDAKRLLWIPDFGDGIPAWKCDGIDNFWQSETTATELTFVEWFLFRNADTAALSVLQESGPDLQANDGRLTILSGGDDSVFLRIKRDGVLSGRFEIGVASAFDGSWVLLRREFASPGNNSDNIAFLNNVAMTLSTEFGGNPGTGTESLIHYLGMRGGLTGPFNGHYRVHLFASPIPSAGQIAATEAQINLEYGVY